MTGRAAWAIPPLIGLTILAGLADAKTDCDTIEAIVDAAQRGEAPSHLPLDAAECGQSIALGGRSAVHCAWVFALRAPEAEAFFDGMARAAMACAGAKTGVTNTPAVNHPDSYDLRQFRLDGVTLSVSIKDKAALGRTYVFIRAERDP